MLSTLLVSPLGGASLSLILIIVGLVLLFFAAFITPNPTAEAPFYRRIHLGWAGLFFLALAVALAG